jgi:SAM-dependent methyltransferase
MRLFSFLEENATLYEWAQRIASLDYRAILGELRREGFFDPRRSYLDLGCGTGFLRDHLREADYTGIDLNPRYVEAARRRRGDVFQVGDVLDLGGLPRQFDRILCIGLLHHLDDAQVRLALAQCRSRLTPDGEIFLIDALWPPGWNPVGRALRRMDNGAFVRTLAEWDRLLGTAMQPQTLRPFAQWPFDYVFVRGR